MAWPARDNDIVEVVLGSGLYNLLHGGFEPAPNAVAPDGIAETLGYGKTYPWCADCPIDNLVDRLTVRARGWRSQLTLLRFQDECRCCPSATAANAEKFASFA